MSPPQPTPYCCWPCFYLLRKQAAWIWGLLRCRPVSHRLLASKASLSCTAPTSSQWSVPGGLLASSSPFLILGTCPQHLGPCFTCSCLITPGVTRGLLSPRFFVGTIHSGATCNTDGLTFLAAVLQFQCPIPRPNPMSSTFLAVSISNLTWCLISALWHQVFGDTLELSLTALHFLCSFVRKSRGLHPRSTHTSFLVVPPPQCAHLQCLRLPAAPWLDQPA